MSNHLATDLVAVDKTKVWVPSTEEHLNSRHTPDQPAAKTDWAYLTTDGSNDAPYLDSTAPVAPAIPDRALVVGGDYVKNGSDYVVVT